MAYNFNQIEQKWQKKWEEKKAFHADEKNFNGFNPHPTRDPARLLINQVTPSRNRSPTQMKMN